MNQTHTLLVQLPIPQLNFARQTGNIPLGIACLKMAADRAGLGPVTLLSQRLATYLGDAALFDTILARQPEIVGFGVYNWNLDRSLHLARRLKAAYGPKILFGGPEITPDNDRIRSSAVDFYIYGEGESLFIQLLKDNRSWQPGCGAASADGYFESGLSPYPLGLLEPEIENMTLIETQRGCPHRCGYCYYGKARQRIGTVPASKVIETLRWTRENHIAEAYLLDPCLNARRDLEELLNAIRQINHDHRLKLISEIRAEAISEKTADALADAGFTWFEIGLQSINPAALNLMKRPTDLKEFLKGVLHLKERGIKTEIDLIAGLPGDDPEGFLRSLAFVVDNGLIDDVQVFPLSVLPGTPFRKAHKELGLVFDPSPPYTLLETQTFSNRQIVEALDEAQKQFDLCLYPFPDLDLSGCTTGFLEGNGNLVCTVDGLEGETISKVLINKPETPMCLGAWASRLSHPYQLVFGRKVVDQSVIFEMVRGFSAVNPFTPFEVVLVEPKGSPYMERFLDACQLQRPHYLDNDLRFLYPDPGNRALLLTLLSSQKALFFEGPMQRQVFWWEEDHLPDRLDLEKLEVLDGIFIPDVYTQKAIDDWLTLWASEADTFPLITFAHPATQKKWISLTRSEDYWLDLLPLKIS